MKTASHISQVVGNITKRGKHSIIVSIDPDIDDSGVYLLNQDTGTQFFCNMSFFELVEMFKRDAHAEIGHKKMFVVLMECSWGTAHNWHIGNRDSKAVAAKKGYHVGRNHQTGKLLTDMAISVGLDVIPMNPARKIWGKDHKSKISHKELAAFVPDLPSRTNQDQRDACLQGWRYAGNKVIIKK